MVKLKDIINEGLFKKKPKLDFDSQLEKLKGKINYHNIQLEIIEKMEKIDVDFESYIDNYKIPPNLDDEKLNEDAVNAYINKKKSKIKDYLKTKSGWDFEKFRLERELKQIMKEYDKLLKEK